MTVKELREKLAQHPDDMEIIIYNYDGRTNGSPLDNIEANRIYLSSDHLCGDVFKADLPAHKVPMDADVWNFVKSTKPRVLVFYPSS